jgi:hypothetical protein
LLCLLATWPVQAQLRLQLVEENLSAEEISASRALLEQARALLPPNFGADLAQPIRVQWSDQLPGEVYGRSNRKAYIRLNRQLLDILLDPQSVHTPSVNQHRSRQQDVLATLLHELLHLYDSAAVRKPQRPPARCRVLEPSPECKVPAAPRFRLSEQPRLLELAGWPNKAAIGDGRVTQNQMRVRSPDAYELQSPQEFLAVNFEYFLLDPQYACRRPQLAGWLAEQFQWHPPSQDCSQGMPHLSAGRNFQRQAIGSLDPERIYQVDYLQAEANAQWMSRWGHSMLRLVICQPGRPRGEDCRLDLEYHLVLSFRAFVGDVQLSSWDGLTGNYPSRLFILPLQQVVDEYTKVELRSLSSIPLQLSRQQINGLVTQAVQMHWSYDGDYLFITNNCATETLRLLQVGTAHPNLQQMRILTPIDLQASLGRRGLLDDNWLDDPNEALRLGYFFDSYQQRYQLMFDVLQKQMPLPQTRVEDWFDLPAAQRREWFTQTDLRGDAALLLLEHAALRRQMLIARDELKRRYLSGQPMPEADSLLAELLVSSGFLSRPGDLLDSGYGLPQADERDSLEQRGSELQQQLKQLNEQMETLLQQFLEPQRLAEMAQARDNLQWLSEKLRQQHLEREGLQL